MKKYRFAVILWSVLMFTVIGYAHEGHSKKPLKVTDSSVISTSPDTVTISPKTFEQIETERDFEAIRQDVESSSIFIVFKAIGLALAIGGLAFVYLRKGNEGDE